MGTEMEGGGHFETFTEDTSGKAASDPKKLLAEVETNRGRVPYHVTPT